MGCLVLDHLCPPLLALVLDGIKSSVPSLFGKVRNTPCKFFEESVKDGESSCCQEGLWWRCCGGGDVVEVLWWRCCGGGVVVEVL